MTDLVVKWGTESYEVPADMEDNPLTFKAQLFALTGVAPERQKTFFKGKQLGNDNWDALLKAGIKKGSVLKMMGSADAVPHTPQMNTIMAEEMTDAQYAAALNLPMGLKNLGNTCYMNATLQCLKTVPVLRDALQKYPETLTSAMKALAGQPDAGKAMTAVVRDLYKLMDNTRGDNEVMPIIMLQVLHMVVPRFSEKDDHGHLAQQDANEFWTELVQLMASQSNLAISPGTAAAANVVHQQMTGQLTVKLTCKEAPEEEPVTSVDQFVQLACYLSQETKYLQSGLRLRLNEELVKHSPSLGKDATYEKASRISRLPAYLAINMMRFQFKEGAQVSAKILKDVKFTMQLDLFELCEEKLQEKIRPARELMHEAEDQEQERKKKAILERTDDKVHYTAVGTEFEEDPGSNNNGFYELQAVLTHKGRSSNSGHYVAWVRARTIDETTGAVKTDNWAKCDDETIHMVTAEDVLKLSGGGDWHTAYVLLYGPRLCLRPLPKESAANGNGEANANAME